MILRRTERPAWALTRTGAPAYVLARLVRAPMTVSRVAPTAVASNIIRVTGFRAAAPYFWAPALAGQDSGRIVVAARQTGIPGGGSPLLLDDAYVFLTDGAGRILTDGDGLPLVVPRTDLQISVAGSVAPAPRPSSRPLVGQPDGRIEISALVVRAEVRGPALSVHESSLAVATLSIRAPAVQGPVLTGEAAGALQVPLYVLQAPLAGPGAITGQSSGSLGVPPWMALAVTAGWPALSSNGAGSMAIAPVLQPVPAVLVPPLTSGGGGGGGYTLGWEAPVQISTVGDTIVNTDGTLVAAYNTGATIGYTINGVTFVGSLTIDTLSNYAANNAYYSDGGVSADFQALLRRLSYKTGTPGTVTFTGLTAGATYLLQVFSCHNSVGWQQVFTAAGYTSAAAVNPHGWSLICRFVASSASETLSIAVTGSTTPWLNGLQLRLLP